MKNKRWVEENEGYTLYFTPFYDEVEIAHIYLDEDGDYLYCSSETKDDNLQLNAATLEQAKEEAEQMVEQHYTDEINYYTEILRHFKEE